MKKSEANAILGAIGAACAGTAAYFATQPYMWGEDSLDNWKSLLTGIAAVLAPTFYFHQMHLKEAEKLERQAEERANEARRRDEERRRDVQKRDDERTKIASSLRREMFDNLVGLMGSKNAGIIAVVKFRGRSAVFANEELYHDIYDGLINAGWILFMDHELLQAIQDIYRRIKRRNLYLRQLHASLGGRSLDEITGAEFRICKMIEQEDAALAGKIPEAIEKLRGF